MKEFDKVVSYFDQFWDGGYWYPSAVREHTYYVRVPGPLHPSDFEVIADACHAMGWQVLSVAAGNMPGYFEFMLTPNDLEVEFP